MPRIYCKKRVNPRHSCEQSHCHVQSTLFLFCSPAFYYIRNGFCGLIFAPLQYPDKRMSRSATNFLSSWAVVYLAIIEFGLRRIWRILQIKEGVIHRGRRSFAITLFVFRLTKYNTTLSPGFFGQRFNNLQRAALLTSFWRQRFYNFWRAALLTDVPLNTDWSSPSNWHIAYLLAL